MGQRGPAPPTPIPQRLFFRLSAEFWKEHLHFALAFSSLVREFLEGILLFARGYRLFLLIRDFVFPSPHQEIHLLQGTPLSVVSWSSYVYMHIYATHSEEIIAVSVTLAMFQVHTPVLL